MERYRNWERWRERERKENAKTGRIGEREKLKLSILERCEKYMYTEKYRVTKGNIDTDERYWMT